MNISKENKIFMFDLEILVKYIYSTDIPKTMFVSLLSLFYMNIIHWYWKKYCTCLTTSACITVILSQINRYYTVTTSMTLMITLILTLTFNFLTEIL